VKSFRNKLPMVGSAVGSFLGVANAAPIIVFEAPLDNWHQEVSADFAVNRELGRAWKPAFDSSAGLGRGQSF
jgi:hypothetical protein